MTNEKVTVNREYKDRLFKLVFREKKDLLELYNAVNNTAYDNPEDMEVNTLEDVVYMGMKNDLSFLVKDVLNLFEHQSSYSPNLPLRGLFYFADLYRKLIGNKRDIYSSKLIQLPMPQFVIFYNGNKTEPECQELHLSEAFGKSEIQAEPCLECKAVMLNINLGNNQELMERCRRLREYAEFVSIVKANLAKGMAAEQAVDEAVTECVKTGILADVLSAHRQEVLDVLLTEYDEELHIRSEREIAMEEGEKRGLKQGIEQGIERGIEQGIERGKKSIIHNMLSCGVSDEEICKMVECSQSLIDEVRKERTAEEVLL